VQVVVCGEIGEDYRRLARAEAFLHARFPVQLIVGVIPREDPERVDASFLAEAGARGVVVVISAAVLEQERSEEAFKGKRAEFHMVLSQDSHGHLHVVPCARHGQIQFGEDVPPVVHHQKPLRFGKPVHAPLKLQRRYRARVETGEDFVQIVELGQVGNGVPQPEIHRHILYHLYGDVGALARKRSLQEHPHVDQHDVHADA
jgi:hypothetical protein